MTSVSNQIRQTYQNRVLERRLRAGFKTQKEFAAEIGISPTILCEIESNRQFLSSIYGLRISEILGCRLDDLYEKKRNQNQ